MMTLGSPSPILQQGQVCNWKKWTYLELLLPLMLKSVDAVN